MSDKTKLKPVVDNRWKSIMRCQSIFVLGIMPVVLMLVTNLYWKYS